MLSKQASNNGRLTVVNIPNGLENNEIQCTPKRVPITPPHLPKLHTLAGAFGVVRSGKTVAFMNLITAYKQAGSLNLFYCISPTYESNATVQTIEWDKVFTDPSHGNEALDEIIQDIQKKHLEYEESIEYKKAFKRWLKNRETVADIHLLGKKGYAMPETVEWPQACIFIDDMTNTNLMINKIESKLANVALRHRHIDGVGVTIFAAFQTFKAGMPVQVRKNLGLILLFPNCNMKEIEDIYTEVSNNISYQKFREILFEATKDQHSFLCIDKLCDDPTKQFGINFNQKFIIDPVEERRKVLKLDHEPNQRIRQRDNDKESPAAKRQRG